ncbi:MAG TPA: aminotransferase class V-fold PLP-dependent enzyme [Gemmatimonadaceae bacterium]|nr:aminotransferase class V-fold PLP-dependent enzyme [Gemmatimonadaceae bacterium]
MTYDLAHLRKKEFPWAERGERVYLNHASTGPLPARSIEAIASWAAMRGQPWRISDDEEIAVMHRARELAARLVSASPDEIALTPNTSHGINIASRCLPLRAGDVVITPDREFPANVYPWMALGREGIVYERVPCTALGVPDEDAILSALDRPRVRVLSLSWVSFATGYTFDLERIGRACRQRGIYFVVDAIQGVGARPLDARACLIDILACGGQKWLLSQWGTGFAYVRRELVQELEPRQIGWLAVRDSYDFSRLVDYDLTWYGDARRFEVGTLPYHDLAAFCTSLEMLLDVGIDRIASHVDTLIDNAISRLHAADATVVTPHDPAHRAAILTVRVKNPARASEQLARAGIVCSLREGAIRLSPHLYSTSGDMDRALEVLLPEV